MKHVRTFLLFPLLFFIFASVPAQALEPTYDAQVRWALHLLEQGRYSEAVDAVQTVVNTDPNAAPSYQLRGTLGLLIGNPARAVNDLHIAAVRAPHEPLTAYALALASLLSGRTDEAQSELVVMRQMPELTTREAQDTDTALAYTHYLRGDNSGALSLIQQDPDNGDNGDSMRAALSAMLAARDHSTTGTARLADFLQTANNVPVVKPADGLHALFATSSVVLEPSVTEASLQQTYSARLTDRMAAIARQAGQSTAVSGIVTLGADLSGVAAPAFVTFRIDGAMASLVNNQPYTYQWNTREVANGKHTVEIVATDASGTVLATQTRALRVSNQGQSAAFGGRGDLKYNAYVSIQHRLWTILQLRPAREAMEWTLSGLLEQQGSHDAATHHRLIAAALNPDYQGGGQFARALFPNAPQPDRIWLGNPKLKEVALTFDDGPNPDRTPALLTALEKAHAPATFFVVGMRAAAAPSIIRQMITQGDEVESHSYSHPNMTLVVPADAEREILRTSVIIQSITGRQPRFFRPPGGDANPSVISLAQSYGLQTAFWTADALHAEQDNSAAAVTAYVLGHVRPGAIVLLHNGAEATIKAIPDLVQALRAHGYRLVTLRQLVAGGMATLPPTKKLHE